MYVICPLLWGVQTFFPSGFSASHLSNFFSFRQSLIKFLFFPPALSFQERAEWARRDSNPRHPAFNIQGAHIQAVTMDLKGRCSFPNLFRKRFCAEGGKGLTRLSYRPAPRPGFEPGSAPFCTPSSMFAFSAARLLFPQALLREQKGLTGHYARPLHHRGFLVRNETFVPLLAVQKFWYAINMKYD